MSENMIFCIGEGRHARQGAGYQKNHRAFNKQVTKERFCEIDTEVKEILKNLKLNPNVKSKSWEDEWKKVTNAEWSKLSEIPEFDLDVVERIVGFRPFLGHT